MDAHARAAAVADARPLGLPRHAVAPDAVLTALVAIAAAQVADLVTFLRMIAVAGVGAELNPLVARGAETLGVAALVVAKLALIVLVAASFAIIVRRHRRLAATVAAFGTLAGLIGAASNILAIA